MEIVKPKMMSTVLPRARDVIVETIEGWLSDRALSMGASLAFYTTFSMAPLLLIAISIAGFWFGNDAARTAVVSEFEALAGSSAAQSINALLLNAHIFGPGVIGITAGVFTFLVSATAAFIELQDDLNIILRADPPPVTRYWSFIRQRLISLAMIVAIGFLLMVSLAVDAGMSAFNHYLDFDAADLFIAAAALIGNVVMSILLFTLIFRFLPTIRLPWSTILAGGAFTGIMFIVGKFLIGFYLGQSHVASTFGAAASLITVLLWVYYSSQIFLIGAEFMTSISGRRHQKEVPDRAKRTKSEDRVGVRNTRSPRA
jgi:membrane protein